MKDATERMTREEVAKAEIGHTAISPRTARLMTAGVLVLICGVPVAQHVWELARDPSRLPGPLDIFRRLPAAGQAWRRTNGSPLRKLFSANAEMLRNIEQFEDDLDDASVLSAALLGPTQELMVRLLGQGNEKAYVGRDGWLFYRPGIDYVAGPPVLDPGELERRRRSGNECTPGPQPDPRRAILQFHEQLRARGIRLLVVPAPVKPMIHPEEFSSRYETTGTVVSNPSQERLLRELRERGVLVFDPAPLLARTHAETGRAQFLPTDTHWTPEAMGLTAQRLAEFISRNVALSPGRAMYRRRPVKARNVGDIAAMLRLPEGQRLFPPREVLTRQVFDARSRMLWRADRGAEVLLLGDSFANVYSLDAMGWGESAGLVEQLSCRLRRPIDRLVRNDAGAWATRHELSRQLARGHDRLAGKKLVVWEFAARELAVGDWKLLDMKLGKPRPSKFLVPVKGRAIVVTGTVAAASPAPRPGLVPYKDHILQLHLIDLIDEAGRPIGGSGAVVFVWSMRDNHLMPAARYREGQEVTLRIEAWEGEPELRYGSIRRSELSEDDVQGLNNARLWWGQPVRRPSTASPSD